ncbi:hypothetical protein Plhal304r1_c091g0171801 [Plasmopara halstedii]
METLPLLDEAITYLQAEIAALRAGEKDSILPSLAVAVAAGEAPLPEPQFTPLLARWTPRASSFSTELAALVDQFEAAKRREMENEIKREKSDANLPVHSALQRVRGQRTRPRTRPRRRFEDPDTGDASPSASDGTPTASPREDVGVNIEKNMKVEENEEEKKIEKEVDDQMMEEKKEEKEEKIEEIKSKEVKINETKNVGTEKFDVQEQCENMKRDKEAQAKMNEDDKMKTEGSGREEEKNEKQVVKAKNPEKEEAEAALASLKSLRKSMLLDVLSKIVSVAKSKGVDPAIFTKDGIEISPNEKKVDLKTIQERVASGIVCEWAQFAEQVNLFCQHVVTNAEQREQAEARRKGVELLHFARTLTETLRKASVKKEMILLQKIQDAEEAAAAREKACINDSEKFKYKNDKEDEHVEEQKFKPTNGDDLNMTVKNEDTRPSLLTPTRALRQIRQRPSLPCDSIEHSPSPLTKKRIRDTSISAASASEDASGSESHDASTSDADVKSRGRVKSSKTSAKRTPTRRRRLSIPATRTSSRQQKRRAAAAAAAAVDSGDEGGSGGEVLMSLDEKEEGEGENDDKKKKVKSKVKKKVSRNKR